VTLGHSVTSCHSNQQAADDDDDDSTTRDGATRRDENGLGRWCLHLPARRYVSISSIRPKLISLVLSPKTRTFCQDDDDDDDDDHHDGNDGNGADEHDEHVVLVVVPTPRSIHAGVGSAPSQSKLDRRSGSSRHARDTSWTCPAAVALRAPGRGHRTAQMEP
jgi:hypothetical protein